MKKIMLFWALIITNCIQASKTHSITVYSTAMGKTIPVLVIVPDKTTAKSNYPVIYILHGYSGTPQRTLSQDIPSLTQRADTDQVIFVLPDGGFNSWYVDSPVNKEIQYETFISKELPSYTDAHFPTKKGPKNCGLLGWSMGGFGTLTIGSQHPEAFGILGSMCGVIDFRDYVKEYDIDKVLGNDGFVWEQYVVTKRIAALKTSGQRILLDCGTDDPLAQQNRQFHDLLVQHKILHDYVEHPGNHNAAYWSQAALVQLDFFKRFFDGK